MSRFATNKEQVVTRTYEDMIKAPNPGLEILLAFNDPNSLLNQDLNALIIKHAITEEEIKELYFQWAIEALNERAREKEEFLMALRIADLKAMEHSLSQQIPAVEGIQDPVVTQLKQEIADLQKTAGELINQHYRYLQQQNNITRRWTEAQRQSAHEFVGRMVDFALTHQQPFTTPDGRVIEMTPERIAQLEEAFMLPSPAILSEILQRPLEEAVTNNRSREQFEDTLYNQNDLKSVFNVVKWSNINDNDLSNKDVKKKAKEEDQRRVAMEKERLIKECSSRIADSYGLDHPDAETAISNLVNLIKTYVATNKVAHKFLAGGKNRQEAISAVRQSLAVAGQELFNILSPEDQNELISTFGMNKPARPSRHGGMLNNLLEMAQCRKQDKKIVNEYIDISNQIESLSNKLSDYVSLKLDHRNHP